MNDEALSALRALPRVLHWSVDSVPVHIAFITPRQVRADDFNSDIPSDWLNLTAFADVDVSEGGGARYFYCVDRLGRVVRLDPEADTPVTEVNKDISAFVAFLNTFDSCVRAARPPSSEELATLERVDGHALLPAQEWGSLAEMLAP